MDSDYSYMTYICITLIILILIYCILCYAGNRFLFHPTKCNSTIKDRINDMKVENDFITTKDGIKIHYIYIINPNSDIVFLHAHGNGGRNVDRFDCETVKYLLKYGSVFMFDYRGFGKSSGSPNETGLYIDILTVWNHLINLYEPDNIILVGTSLGGSIVSWLGAHLANENRDMPKLIIIQSSFYNLEDISSIIFGKWAKYMCRLIGFELNNYKNIKTIKKHHPNYDILILHSLDDELIPYDQSANLAKHTGAVMIDVGGSHNCMIVDDTADKIIIEYFEYDLMV
jgi:predicted esterase YcpF (UPF0227 family)